MSSNTDCVLTLRLGRQRVAVLFEVQHEVAGQDWLRGERVAENLLNLRLVDLHRRGDAAAHLSGRVRMIEQDRLLGVSIVTAPELPSALGSTTNSDWRLEQDASRRRIRIGAIEVAMIARMLWRMITV